MSTGSDAVNPGEFYTREEWTEIEFRDHVRKELRNIAARLERIEAGLQPGPQQPSGAQEVSEIVGGVLPWPPRYPADNPGFPQFRNT
jgi:hypothetical protein